MNLIYTHSHIHRTFRDLSKEEDSYYHLTSLLIYMGWSGAFGWDKPLESRQVLNISEAGTGKTHEGKAQQDFLWDQGETAFYLELASLATNDLYAVLALGQETRFDSWLTSQPDVAFFSRFDRRIHKMSRSWRWRHLRTLIILTHDLSISMPATLNTSHMFNRNPQIEGLIKKWRLQAA